MNREVEFKDGQGSSLGSLKVEYEGLARATKDVDQDVDGREVNWEKEARTGRFNISLELNGNGCMVKHDLSPDNWTQGGNYTVDCGGSKFQVQYVSKWGLDEVVVQTDVGLDPLLQMAVAFVLAYWLHPKRAEEVAAGQAMQLLQARVGTW